ncbi:Suf-domain-containing protein [Dentipellis sp. KUC8613]|nr:Suf-domain-containing protein [Dentipellis sp. KUC8613]
MSEPPPAEQQLSQSSDTTQPSQEILEVLQQLNVVRKTTPPDGQNGSMKEEPDVPMEPPSEWDRQRAQLREKPHDPEGWNKLVDIAESSGDLEKIKETYEALLEMYPNTASAQIAYLNHFLNPGSFQFAESLFKRFLLKSPSVELLRFYVTYVRRMNVEPDTRDTVRKAYEFALNHGGQDKDSGDIWMDYIQFLRAGETNSTWEEQQKMDALRKVYHRAVQIPLENVETLWQELEAFENGLNRITAKKFMNDLSPAYMQARTVLRLLQRHLGPLFPPLPPSASSRPPLYLPRLPTFNTAERALVGAWKSYLRWEESNPLEIEERDKATLIARVQGVYRKALIRMRFYGEIWYMAYVWTNSVGKSEEAVNILKAGIEANPSSFLLNFAYAETLEVNNAYAEVHAVYDKFLNVLRQDLDEFEKRVTEAGPTPPSTQSQSQGNELGVQSQNSSFNSQASDSDKPPRSKDLKERRTEYGLVWTMYLRFARRAEGLKSSRNVFGKARREKWTPWEVYESAALMEYHCTKDMGVASRIFEKGLEAFGDEVDFVSHYLGFLLSVNDENNARALFERVINSFPADRARVLWERWARHEYQYGDLAAAQKLEKRMAEVYPNDPPIKRFAQRHTYHSTDAIASRDLGLAMARQTSNGSTSGSSPSLGRTETQQSLLGPPPSQPPPAPVQTHAPAPPPQHKRAPSPEAKRREDSYGPPAYKRQRPSSPPPRDRWEGHGRRRYNSPSWDRDRDRDGPPPRGRGGGPIGGPPPPKEEEEKTVTLPLPIAKFVGALPNPATFDGPVFRTDDLMQVFRNAVIPSATRARSPPPPPRGGGRPPPDYGPYQGPGGGRRRY